MNESENKFAAEAGSTVEEVQGDLQSLRMLMSLALVLLIVFGLCVDIFVFRQASMIQSQVAQTEKLMEGFNPEPSIRFWAKVNEYARTHPDFVPILSKYSPIASQTLLNPAFAHPKK